MRAAASHTSVFPSKSVSYAFSLRLYPKLPSRVKSPILINIAKHTSLFKYSICCEGIKAVCCVSLPRSIPSLYPVSRIPYPFTGFFKGCILCFPFFLRVWPLKNQEDFTYAQPSWAYFSRSLKKKWAACIPWKRTLKKKGKHTKEKITTLFPSKP